jgi:hypothetical protein
MSKTKFRITLVIMTFLVSQYTISQNLWEMGVTTGIQGNSAILPNLKLNDNLHDVFTGNEVVKGVPQYAKLTLNYRVGGYMAYEGKMGFTRLDITYVNSKIYKEYSVNLGILGEPSLTVIDRKYGYIDGAVSYNLFLNQSHTFYAGIGGSFALLTHYTKDESPEKTGWNGFLQIGVKLNDKVEISLKPSIGIDEVYKDSYIHHIMVPLSVGVILN